MKNKIANTFLIFVIMFFTGCSGSQGISPAISGSVFYGATPTPDAGTWERDEYSEGLPRVYNAHAAVIKGTPYLFGGLNDEDFQKYVFALKGESEWVTVTASDIKIREGASSAQGPDDALYCFGKNDDKKTAVFFNDAYLYNGISFTAVPLSGQVKARAYAAAYYYKDSYYVHGGSDRQQFFNDIVAVNAKNGLRTIADKSAVAPRSGHSAVSYRGKIYIAGGRSAAGLMNDVWVSENGVDFKAATLNAAFAPRENFVFLVYKDRMFISGGRGEKGLLNDTWFSVDGVYWNRAAADSIYRPRELAASFVTKDYMAIAGGRSDKRIYSDIWRAK